MQCGREGHCTIFAHGSCAEFGRIWERPEVVKEQYLSYGLCIHVWLCRRLRRQRDVFSDVCLDMEP